MLSVPLSGMVFFTGLAQSVNLLPQPSLLFFSNLASPPLSSAVISVPKMASLRTAARDVS